MTSGGTVPGVPLAYFKKKTMSLPYTLNHLQTCLLDFECTVHNVYFRKFRLLYDELKHKCQRTHLFILPCIPSSLYMNVIEYDVDVMLLDVWASFFCICPSKPFITRQSEFPETHLANRKKEAHSASKFTSTSYLMALK